MNRRICRPIKIGYYKNTLFPQPHWEGLLEVTFNDQWLPDYAEDTGIVDVKTGKWYEVEKHFISLGCSVLLMKYKSINPVGLYAIACMGK